MLTVKKGTKILSIYMIYSEQLKEYTFNSFEFTQTTKDITNMVDGLAVYKDWKYVTKFKEQLFETLERDLNLRFNLDKFGWLYETNHNIEGWVALVDLKDIHDI